MVKKRLKAACGQGGNPDIYMLQDDKKRFENKKNRKNYFYRNVIHLESIFIQY